MEDSRMKMIQRLKDKRGESDMSDEHKEAKRSMLKQLMGDMSGMMAEPLHAMKKVSVASDSKQGLEKGLEKAKDMLAGDQVEKLEEESHQDLDNDAEAGESPEHKEAVLGEEAEEEKDPEQMSPEELDMKIKELMELKQAKMAE